MGTIRSIKRANARKKANSPPIRLISSPTKHPLFGLADRLFDPKKNRQAVMGSIAKRIDSHPPASKKKPDFMRRGTTPKGRPHTPIALAKRPIRAGNARTPNYKFRYPKKG